MQTLDKTLRGQLERTVMQARELAEAAARASLEQLGVDAAKRYEHLTEAEAELRRRLRAHGRQLGDQRNRVSEAQEIERLTEEVAYEHWHRMLFARFLAENNLLMYPDPDQPVAVTLAECEDMAADEGAESGWELASRYAAKMLPQIFKPYSPVFQLKLPPESQHRLERLVEDLPLEVFHASDALGWVYQFWQAKKKDEVNKSEKKIGARELSPVTQLFTEPYMVNFLLDNSLGAWWAGQKLTEADFKAAESEVELRDKVALPGLPLDYLRFAKDDADTWLIAAGPFANWPRNFSELKVLDPCCGSGHFLVAALLMLVPMRIHAEGLSAREAVKQVLAQNLYGLELDARCVELAAFALALTGWRLGGGYFEPPPLQVACTGLSISSSKEQWMAMLEGQAISHNQRIVFGQFYDLFSKAPTLGSLINPSRYLGKIWLTAEEMAHLQSVLADAVKTQTDTEKLELGVTAQGLAKATELLSGQYSLVATNVPYLGRGKQDETLREYVETQYPLGKADLATAFVLRCLEFCAAGSGATALVTPQNWLFLTSYTKLREWLLRNQSWHLVARLGEHGFESSAAAGAFVALVNLSAEVPLGETQFAGIDVSGEKSAEGKAELLRYVDWGENGRSGELMLRRQMDQLKNPDVRIQFSSAREGELINSFAECYQGLVTGDIERFTGKFWEFSVLKNYWEPFRRSSNKDDLYGDVSNVVRWELGEGTLHEYANKTRSQLHDMHESGNKAWKKKGIAINRMRNLNAVPYYGEHFDNNVAVVFPKKPSVDLLNSMARFLSSSDFVSAIKEIDTTLKVTNKTLLKVPFDLEHWSKVAAEQYPNGLPQPYSNDPTQWVFHGHPCGSVIWDKQAKWTAEGELQINKNVLQVAVARLLGYRWPAELNESMELSAEQRAWIQRCDALLSLADADGLVCIPSIRGETAAADRLLALLSASYGEAWSRETLDQLLNAADYAGKNLDVWLRDGFFAQHCELFQQRPFIWQIWDGLRDGFSVLVNSHQLNAKRLETLIYTYLGDWITRQKQDLVQGIDGAEAKLNAAERLKKRLEQILQGEAPYDIFVRWKPIQEQPIGWNPDLNDGVRFNIRPFLEKPDIKVKDAGVLRVKPKINWDKDRGKDPMRSKAEYPWSWGWDGSTDFAGGETFTGERWNDCHYSLGFKQQIKEKQRGNKNE